MPAFTSATYSRYTGKWLIGTGILELALAAAFLVFGLAEAELTFGLWPHGSDPRGDRHRTRLVRAARPGSAAGADRIASTGIAGTATVTGLTQTGMSLNDQPQVEIGLLVSIPGRAPNPATRKDLLVFEWEKLAPSSSTIP